MLLVNHKAFTPRLETEDPDSRNRQRKQPQKAGDPGQSIAILISDSLPSPNLSDICLSRWTGQIGDSLRESGGSAMTTIGS
ncbi:MAG: hypothetical protein Kow0074_14510 [Candidatus Zixiibacteriota bacterium]